jgi:uncharacterized membrane protein YhaH (DUF805 family)
MLDYIFGFNARLGRLAYFGANVAVFVIATLVFAALIMANLHPMPARRLASFADIQTWPMMIAFIAFILIGISLQCMRIRDIGWDPICVIPAWIAALLIDCSVAMVVPEWSIGPERFSGTIAGPLIKIAGGLVLTFWPSGSRETSMQVAMR